jgi:hypothetical protein
MSEVRFEVLDASAEPYAAVPTMRFRLALEAPPEESIRSIALRCQIRIEPQRRHYSARQEATLNELFGAGQRWGETLKPFLWTHVSAMVPGFSGRTEIDLHVPCTYDFEVAAAKYLHALDEGEIPLLFLFSGTVFAAGAAGLQVTQVSWDRESRLRLPARTWHDVMDLYFPNEGWLRLRRDTLSRLLRYKASAALATWEEVMDTLLAGKVEAA